jgi:hypothetical protein
MQIRKFNSQQTMQWLSCGLRFSRRAPVLWSAVALIDVVILYLLEQIPLVGDVVLLFLMPAALVSGLRATRDLTGANGTRPKPAMTKRLIAPLRAALGVFANANDAIVIALIGLVVMAVGLVIQIAFQVVGGAALTTPAMLYDMGVINALHYLGAYVLIWILLAPLVLVLFYALPLFFIEDVPLGEALGLAGGALVKNGLALLPFVATLLAPLFVAILAFKIYWGAGLVLTAIAAFVTVPVGINSAYCSYKLTFH